MNPQTKESFQDRAQAALRFAGTQVRHLITKYPNYFPLFTVRGKWKHESEAWTNWCEGFLGGMLWILFRHSGDTWWRERAEHYSRLIEHRKTDRNVHDLGFLFLPITTIVYAWMANNHMPLEGINLLILLVAVLFDLGGLGGGEYHRRSRW